MLPDLWFLSGGGKFLGSMASVWVDTLGDWPGGGLFGLVGSLEVLVWGCAVLQLFWGYSWDTQLGACEFSTTLLSLGNS